MSCGFVVCNIEWGRGGGREGGGKGEGRGGGRGGGKGSMLHLDSVPTIESMIVGLTNGVFFLLLYS